MKDKELYRTIVEHRYKFTKLGGVDYNLHQPQSINPIPSPELMKAWKADYNIMLEQMIYEENAPTFEEIISDLINLKNKVNGLEWKFDMEFPRLKS